MAKLKLGKLQKAWIKSLKEHPERQMTKYLGKGTPKNYTACCLGQLLITDCKLKKKRIPFNKEGHLENGTITSLQNSFKKYGLRDEEGIFEEFYTHGNFTYLGLADMNDYGLTWTEIADFVEENPDMVFTKSV